MNYFDLFGTLDELFDLFGTLDELFRDMLGKSDLTIFVKCSGWSRWV